jgi:hypothetical protein
LSLGGTHMYHLENFQILEFLRILKKYFQQMLEASRSLYKIAWIIECMDDIERCTLRSFDPTPLGVILWKVYQSLHRLHQNGMKLSELVGLVPVVIAVGSKQN